MKTTWYPEPLTGREVAEQVASADVAGVVEAAPWSDAWLTADDRRAYDRPT